MENRSLVARQVGQGNETAPQGAPVEKVFHFGASREPSEPGRRDGAAGRDWAAAIELVKEASEAIRLAEKKAAEADSYSHELAAQCKEHIKAAEARIAAAERRAEAATKRAVEAEEWLAKFHDAIVDGFGAIAQEVA